MIWRHFGQGLLMLICAICVWTVPVSAESSAKEVMDEKRAEVAMRMIGHEVLLNLGDSSSRVLPIERTDNRYRIPFEFDFGCDPDTIVSIVGRVMAETGIAGSYLVEVEQCATHDIVHSFMVGNANDEHMIPCKGRVLPQDCYTLLITLTDGSEALSSADRSNDAETQEPHPLRSALFIFPFLLLVGAAGYVLLRRKRPDADPHVITLGATRFDQRKMTLTFGNEITELSNKETELLSLLYVSANEPVGREVILKQVWGDDGDYVGRTLDVFISKLRKKLEADTGVRIVNIRGVGYKLVVDGAGS